MEPRGEALPSAQPGWFGRIRASIRARALRLLPFAGGVLAALLGMAAYNALNPPAPPLTEKDVSAAVQEAMAAATPAPAYSALVYQAVHPSLVLIQSSGHSAGGEAHGGLGSGVVVSAQGDILTALHVVEGAQEIEVTFADGTQTSAQVVAAQPENDIAVLQPGRLPDVLVPAMLGNPNAAQIGDEAYAVGSPFGLYGSMSSGVISGFERSFQVENSEKRLDGLIQFDAAVNPGNSGGPLLNRSGQVIGIVVGILNPTEQEFFIGIGFAVPINIAGAAAGAPQY